MRQSAEIQRTPLNYRTTYRGKPVPGHGSKIATSLTLRNEWLLDWEIDKNLSTIALPHGEENKGLSMELRVMKRPRYLLSFCASLLTAAALKAAAQKHTPSRI
jgi:hypothetical protein